MATREQRSAVLKKIYERDGGVRASVVVEEARPKRSPIHDEFEWDDAKAAHQYRLSTARRMIQVTPIKVDSFHPSQRLVNVPPVVVEGPTAVTNEREGIYKPVIRVAENRNEYERALAQLSSQLHAIDRTISELKAAAGEPVDLLPQLTDALKVAKQTLRMMRQSA